MKTTKIITLCLAVFLFTGKSFATDKISACQTDTCKTLFKHYSGAAKRGHTEAMTALGQFYQAGYGTDKNLQKAMYYLKKAARRGSAAAAYKVGLLYFSEPSIKDLEKGKRFLQQASSGDFKDSNFLLGIAYLSRTFGIHDTQEADFYLAKAYKDKHIGLPDVLNLITESQEITSNSFPQLYKAMKKAPMLKVGDRYQYWPKDETEVITITSPPIEEVLVNNLVFFRERSKSLGSRLPNTECKNQFGCYKTYSLESFYNDFPFIIFR
ncbi:tetratricopeptide repeat protein [Thalassotalea euphylliae]|uniref:tetratricopeptide repeat protein n=1 Tax=Thalassotalea euphylliae TaxID=1655234 RepID=UPI003631F3E5